MCVHVTTKPQYFAVSNTYLNKVEILKFVNRFSSCHLQLLPPTSSYLHNTKNTQNIKHFYFQNKLANILTQQRRSLGQWIRAMVEPGHMADSGVWIVLRDMLNVRKTKII